VGGGCRGGGGRGVVPYSRRNRQDMASNSHSFAILVCFPVFEIDEGLMINNNLA
jgi:hypothetical protein